ncbi:hypothetical protein ABZ366_31330 [Streptomyces sp. NPDC005904]|uniref:hypothetical protein n=1 Tax=Streptomyces sp. NPDC005904 TaxID=3154570 RepID=UPI0033C78225
MALVFEAAEDLTGPVGEGGGGAGVALVGEDAEQFQGAERAVAQTEVVELGGLCGPAGRGGAFRRSKSSMSTA